MHSCWNMVSSFVDDSYHVYEDITDEEPAGLRVAHSIQAKCFYDNDVLMQLSIVGKAMSYAYGCSSVFKLFFLLCVL